MIKVLSATTTSLHTGGVAGSIPASPTTQSRRTSRNSRPLETHDISVGYGEGWRSPGANWVALASNLADPAQKSLRAEIPFPGPVEFEGLTASDLAEDDHARGRMCDRVPSGPWAWESGNSIAR
jgi:hypothetical protein